LIAVSKSLQYIREKGLGDGSDYLEFGIYKGFTLWYAQAMARDLGIRDMKFYGFDSFLGLPEVKGMDGEGGEFVTGAYCSHRIDVERFLTQYGADFGSTLLVEGWFDKTLTRESGKKLGHRRCSLVVVDCDLYESTRLVLEYIEPFVADQTIILFDDWNSYNADPEKGERRAFGEFLARNTSFRAESFTEFGGHGEGFILRKTG
jgi:hypothetical protein